MKTFEWSDIQFKIPSNIILAEPSGSGKTTFLLKLLQHANVLMSPPPTQIIYAYGQYNSSIPQIEAMGIQTIEGVPSYEELENKKGTLLIMDDLLTNVSEEYLAELFSKKTHHLGICLIFVTQGLFDKKMKFCRSQAHYVILMKAFSAQLGVRNFGAQNFSHQLPYFMDSYRMATKNNFGYLVVDMSPTCPQELRLRTNIFPEQTVTVFLPRVQV